MASGVDSIQGFSRTPRTTPKSKVPVDTILIVLMTGNIRILIATIRNLGKCPCPRCLIPLNRVHNLGMPRDMMQRDTMACVDNLQCRNAVDAARRIIYDKNFQVNSTGVENILRDMSLVPAAVSCAYFLATIILTNHRMHFPTGSFLLVSTSSQCCSRM